MQLSLQGVTMKKFNYNNIITTVAFLLLLCCVSGQDEAPQCRNGDLRLKRVTNPTKCITMEQPTELQICWNRRWYSVCADSWTGRLSQNTCIDLGYHTGYQLPVNQNKNEEEESANVALFNCTGQVDSIEECTFIRRSCPRRLIIHLKCINEDLNSTRQICTEGELRLASGGVDHSDHLEVCMFGLWGSVCDTDWSRDDSTVACMQLGFTTGTDTMNNANKSVIDQCTIPIHLFNVTCGGREETLASCPHNRITSNNFNDLTCGIALTCLGTRLKCQEGEVKLLPYLPDNPSAGWLLVCLNNEWGTICDTNWDIRDSTVACKQMNYVGGFHVELPASNARKEMYTIHASSMMCTGNESRVIDCQFLTEHDCIHIRDVFLQCREIGDGCGNGELRLVDGPSVKSGRLEMCWNDVWGTVCHIDWIRVNTVVACRQMGWLTGYEERRQILPNDVIPIIIEKTECLGNEQKLTDCNFRFTPAYSCFVHQNDVVMTCLDTDDLVICEDGDVKLVGGANQEEGLLKICHENVWGTVCDSNWDRDIDATVACRQLGFQRSAPTVHSTGRGNGPIHFTNFMCNGDEHSLTNCSFELLEIYSSNCDHSRDVHVACQDPINPEAADDSNVYYALIPIVLLIVGFLSATCVITSCLMFRRKQMYIQPEQRCSVDSSASSEQERTGNGGQFYRNATFVDVAPSPQQLTTVFDQEGHYMVSPSVMGHTYETIDDNDLRAQYKGEYHEYALLEEECNIHSNSLAKSPSTYDKLNDGSCPCTLNSNGREEHKRVQPQPYSMLELQCNVKDKSYNKLQWKKRNTGQAAAVNSEDYEQIDLSDSEVLDNEEVVNYHKLSN